MRVKTIRRLGLVITREQLPAEERENINGPCCIQVPEWCEKKLARFYLYFADHHGRHIKMAYADSPEGPWRVHAGGVLDLALFRDAHDHVASPEIYLDEANRKIRLYFHAKSRRKSGQWTFAAISDDGIHFKDVCDFPLAPFYLRVFPWQGYLYGMTKGGNLCRSRDGLSPFTPGRNPFGAGFFARWRHNAAGSIRHVALLVAADTLEVYYSRIGDAPERILSSKIDIGIPDWKRWQASSEEEVIRPVEHYEGGELPVSKSVSGSARGEENALRDPHVISYSGKQYLFYTVRGESGIAVCELVRG